MSNDAPLLRKSLVLCFGKYYQLWSVEDEVCKLEAML